MTMKPTMNSTRTRIAAALMVGLLAPLPVYADDFGEDLLAPRVDRGQGRGYVLRDERGRRTGTIEQAPGGILIQRDTSGRRVGTIEQGWGGEMVVRDTRGRRVGTIERH